MKFDPPLHFSINDGIELEATFFNNTDEIVEWGLLSVDEMMIAFGLYYEGQQLNNDIKELIPDRLSLHSNFPNPFNPITTLRYDLPQSGMVNITIHNVKGELVKTLVNSYQNAGFKSILWNATNDRNKPVSAGIYLYTIQTQEAMQTKKMILLK